jgi:hypothetical protein
MCKQIVFFSSYKENKKVPAFSDLDISVLTVSNSLIVCFRYFFALFLKILLLSQLVFCIAFTFI